MNSTRLAALQHTVFPIDNASVCKTLYFSGDARINNTLDDASLLLSENQIVKFDGVLNILPVKHWSEYLNIRNCLVIWRAEFVGKAVFRLHGYRAGQEWVVDTIALSSEEVQKTVVFNLSDTLCQWDALSISVSAISRQFEFFSGQVALDREIEPAALAIVFCTYKRVNEVSLNIKTVLEAFKRKPYLYSKSKVWVVDNANELLELIECSDSKLEILSNKNLGGAGGFTRGMLEAIANQFDYVLLCDDDVSFRSEILDRSIAALQFIKDKDRGIHAGMLELESLNTLHSVGEKFDVHRRLHLGYHIGLRILDINGALIVNDLSYRQSESSNLFGWWYTLIPTHLIKQVGLPAPFFISGDDIEYSLRLHGAGYRALIMPSIMIWHPSHQAGAKKSAESFYFSHRNRWITASVHSSAKALLGFLWRALSEAKREHEAGEARYANAIVLAFDDFCKCTDWSSETIESVSLRLDDTHEQTNELLRAPLFVFRMKLKALICFYKCHVFYKVDFCEKITEEQWMYRLFHDVSNKK